MVRSMSSAVVRVDLPLNVVRRSYVCPLDQIFSFVSGPPILKQNFSCVVAGVSLRHQGDGLEVLLIQEAKLSCRGKWYLPAGRVELGETLKVPMRWETPE